MKQSLLDPTYQEYAAALRKVGWTPVGAWVFDGKGVAHSTCVYMYIQARFQAEAIERESRRNFEASRRKGADNG